MNSIRWNVLSGADVLWEYRTARDVMRDGWWSWKLADEYRYYSCLSISVLPVMISGIMGIDLLSVFTYVLPVICSLVPIFIYILAYETFHKPEIAFLSAIIYAESYFTIPSFGREIKRQPIAIIFMLCILIILSKIMMKQKEDLKKNRTLEILLVIFTFGVVVSHYTISFFLLAILMFFCLIFAIFYMFKSFSSKRLKIEPLSIHQLRIGVLYFIFFTVLCVSWNIIVSPRYTMQYFDYISSILTGTTKKSPIQLETNVVLDVLGPIVTFWLLFVIGLGVIGFLLLTRTSKDIKKLILFISGGFILVLYPLWIIRPYESSWYMSLTRFIGVSFIFLCVFAAYTLFKVNRRTRGVFTILFILLNLPINILLPVYHNYVLYSSEKSISPDIAIRQLYNDRHDFAVALWVSNFIDPNEVISSDTHGAHTLFYADNIFAEVINASYANGRTGNIMCFRPFIYVSEDKLHEIRSNFLFLDRFATQYGIWYVAGPARDFRYSEVNMTELLSFSNKIYDDGICTLLYKR